ncbi:MAG: HPr family phosphocarrier protein [Pseudomonadota bacterium]
MSSPEADPSHNARTLSLTMVNRRGLHARAAAKFVRTVERFASTVSVSKDGHTVSGLSIMGLLMLAATPGTSVDVVVAGPDASEAATALDALVSSGFGETD